MSECRYKRNSILQEFGMKRKLEKMKLITDNAEINIAILLPIL